MGEIAEMMLDGTLCEGCGVYLEGDGEGFPRRCDDCGPADDYVAAGTPLSKKVRCCHCPRLVTRAGLKDHMDSKHPGVQHDAKTRCTICNKSVKTVGLPQHIRTVHGQQP
ncbi:hypothetical protein [Burkholderia sp. BCC1644]|uniref:hypothetical protein n=1 Tax=Burkholderia sp. BCC1644 TaxID=2676293 RepID=UPI0015904C50|nr:hypothetical protein [Burkholderia sp. BCC1644]